MKTLLGILLLIIGLQADYHVDTAAQTALPVTPPPDNNLCWDREQAAHQRGTFDDFIASVPRTDGLFQWIEAPDLPRIGRGVYQAQVNDVVMLRYEIYSIDPSRTYRLFVLVNEQPLPIGDSGAAYTDITISPKEPRQTIEFDVPVLTAGIHDVVLALAYNDPELTAFEISSMESGMRLTVVAGNPVASDISFTTLETVPLASANPLMPRLGVTLPDEDKYWTASDIVTLQAGEPLAFDILRGYLSHNRNVNAPDLSPPATDRFALVAYLNGESVMLNDAAVIYSEIPVDTLARVPVEVTQTLNPGEHELVVIAIPHPRVPVCVLNGPSDGYFFVTLPEVTRLTFIVE